MSRKEQGVPSPEKPQQPEEHTIYLRAAHFIDELASQQVYTDIQSTIRTAQAQGEGWQLAGYHLTNQEDVSWYVAVAGKQPTEVLEEKLTTALAAGVPTDLPEAFHDLVTKHQQDPPESTMTVDEWLATDEQADAV